MRSILFLTLLLSFLLPAKLQAEDNHWPAWERYKTHLINQDGRVIDFSDPRHITTSEGQSYALFFALVANDRDTFQHLLDWTQNNLARGDMGVTLPAWLWGRSDEGGWGVLDDNSASDSDLWLAYTLLEAGRLWDRRDYRVLGTRLAGRIAEQETAELAGFGPMLLPGRVGFTQDDLWRVNPSYLPPQILARLSALGAPWPAIAARTSAMLQETAPLGFAPDWAAWQEGAGWQPDPEHGAAGDYDAIRVYLWAGMLAADFPQREALLAHFAPMHTLTARRGVPPESIDAHTGEHEGTGNISFSAALLPFLAGTPAAETQRQRIAANPPAPDAYYSQSLLLFGVGWDEGRYRFAADGTLQPAWSVP